MTNLLKKARVAAQQQDWASLSQYLQQAILGEPAGASSPSIADFLPFVIAVLESGCFQDRWDVAKVLPQFGEGAIAPLVGLVQDPEQDLEARWFAARALGNWDHPLAIQTLALVITTGRDDDLSQIAATALSMIGPAAIPALCPLLAQPTTCLVAAQALAQIDHPDTVPALLSVVDSADPLVRQVAIDALALFQDDRVLAIQEMALTDPVASVRQAAITGLSRRAGQMPPTQLVALLADRLWDINLEVCHQAAISLSRVGDAAIAPLMQVLQSALSPLSLQLEAVRSLGWIGSAAALEQLTPGLHQPELPPSVRQEIVAVLGRWSEPTLKPAAAEALVSFLQSHDFTPQESTLQQTIALSLGQLGQPTALQPLIQLLAVEEMGVRLHAIAALKQLDRVDAHHQLMTLSRQATLPPALSQGIAIALQEW